MSLFAELTASVNAVRPGRTRMRDLPLVIAASTFAAAWPVDGVFGVDRAGRRLALCALRPLLLRHPPRRVHQRRLAGRRGDADHSIRVWQRPAVPLFVLAMILLVAVLIPGIGREVNAPTAGFRWVR